MRMEPVASVAEKEGAEDGSYVYIVTLALTTLPLLEQQETSALHAVSLNEACGAEKC